MHQKKLSLLLKIKNIEIKNYILMLKNKNEELQKIYKLKNNLDLEYKKQSLFYKKNNLYLSQICIQYLNYINELKHNTDIEILKIKMDIAKISDNIKNKNNYIKKIEDNLLLMQKNHNIKLENKYMNQSDDIFSTKLHIENKKKT